jgi:hypothetical protein
MSLEPRDLARQVEQAFHQVTFHIHGPEQIILSITSETRRQEDCQLQVVGKQILERTDGDVRGLIASIDANSFISAITFPGERDIKRHIFDENLRVHLGSNGGFNSSIVATAQSSDSYLFWYLNNGITITCKKYSYNKAHTSPIISLKDFQIVNGAQTSHSLFEAKRAGAGHFDDIVLMVRIYETDRADIAERVAVATNSQAKIQARDLRSNRPIMQRLEAAFRERGIYFERKKNMHADKPDEDRLDALRFGQVVLSWFLGEPDRARSDSDAIFEALFGKIFSENHDIDQLVSILEIYQKIDDLRSDYTLRYGSAPETGDAHQYLIYGHWFILFTARLLLEKEGPRKVPKGKAADQLIEAAIQTVAAACQQHKSVAHYQLFRSPKTKEKIYQEVSGRQLSFLDILFDGD